MEGHAGEQIDPDGVVSQPGGHRPKHAAPRQGETDEPDWSDNPTNPSMISDDDVRKSKPKPVTPKKKRYYGTAKLDPDSLNRDLARINEGVLDQLRLAGASISISLEIHADDPNGFDENIIRIIEGNADQLKLDNSSFEED